MLAAEPLPAPPPGEVIIVTGQALREPLSERLLDVVRFGPEQLHDAPSRRLEQILAAVPGLKTFRRSDAASAHPTAHGVTLRGLGGNAASRALLILDGVPQTDPFGGWTNWPAYDPAALAEVRITRGGGSVAHGPGALAGAIEASSGVVEGVSGLIESGSRDAIDASLLGGLRHGSDSLALALHGARGDGFIPIDEQWRGPADRSAPFRQGNARLRWVSALAAATELQASLSAFHDERDRGIAFTGNRTHGRDASLRLVGRGSWGWSALASGQWRHFRSSFATVDSGRTAAQRVSLQDNVPSSALGWAGEVRPPVGAGRELRIGTDGRLMRGHSHEFSNYVAGEATRERDSGGRAAHAGLFAEGSWTKVRWTFTAAGRLDHWRISGGRLDERSLLTGDVITAARYADRQGWLPTARVAAGYQAGPGLRLRAAGYLGWRMPTLNELFRPFRVGRDATAANAGLDPERLAGVEAGLSWQPLQGLEISATVFANQLRDAIATVTLGQGPGTFPGVGFVAGEYRQRRNLDAVEVRGIEASAAWSQGPWRLRAAYALTDARVDASGAAASLDGLRPAQTPLHSASASAGWDSGRADVLVQLRYFGRQYEDDLNRLGIPEALTVDAFAGWRVSDRLRLVLRGENILDERVVAAVGSDGTIERAIARTIWVGLRFADQRSSKGTP